MFENIIEFSTQEDYFKLQEDLPEPIKLNIPEWFKKLQHDTKNKTVKGCMPFLDTLTTGYLLRLAQDTSIKHNFINTETKQLDSFYYTGSDIDPSIFHAKSINLAGPTPNIHATSQLQGSPHVEKNKNLNFYKFLNPWIIKTPPGYSCLFVPPLNNSDDRFSIIPGIVDTDVFPNEINFPFVINGDKYPQLDTIFKKGTPYVQVIPFKREKWKMKLKAKTTKEMREGKTFYGLNILHNYKQKFWNKKSWR